VDFVLSTSPFQVKGERRRKTRMRKRVGALVTLVVTLALLSLLATVIVMPTVAYDPGTDTVSCYSHTLVAGDHMDDPGPCKVHKTGAAATHNKLATALEAKSRAQLGNNLAKGHIKVWKDATGIRKKGGVHVIGTGDSEVGWDPAGGPAWLNQREHITIKELGGKGRIEMRVTGTDPDLMWAELTPAGLVDSGNWPHGWTVRTTAAGNKIATHPPFVKEYNPVGPSELTVSAVAGPGRAIVKSATVGVGGVAFLPNKLELLAPWIILGLAIPVSIVSIGIYKKKRRA